jgi:hypothetical protein
LLFHACAFFFFSIYDHFICSHVDVKCRLCLLFRTMFFAEMKFFVSRALKTIK